MIAPLRLFDETPLVHRRLSSGATTLVRSNGMSDRDGQSFPACRTPASVRDEVDDPKLAEARDDEFDRDGR
jgi:hypothetical protein